MKRESIQIVELSDKIRDPFTGKWLDSSVFRPEAIRFIKNGYYCEALPNTQDWFNYWEEQLRRCIEGYQVGNHKITGHHYFYLNFTQIQLTETSVNSKSAKKITRQPDFWDGDYDYFWSLEIARNGLYNPDSIVPSTPKERAEFREFQNILNNMINIQGEKVKNDPEYLKIKNLRDEISIKILDRLQLRVKPHLDYVDGGNHMIVGKSRRKGYSFKDGAICANIYNTQRKAQIIIGAADKKFLYPKGTMGMASDYLNFLNEHTAWAKSRDYVDKQEHKKASYMTYVNGRKVEAGYQSEIFALTFKDNPDAARGKDAVIVLLEEAGAFPNLLASYSAIYPALTSGAYITGQIIIFGTGGDMDSGTVDFAEMFYHPEAHGLMPFQNIWDDNASNTYCGFFHPVTWNLEGFYDEQGNSDIEAATKFEMDRRARIIKNSNSSLAIQQHVQEFALCPSEAFLTVSSNIFPTIELRNQLNKVEAHNLNLIKGQPVTLLEVNGIVKAIPDLKDELKPILNQKPKEKDLTGAVVIYEYPVDNAPRGLYKIGFDPYAQDIGTSLAAIYVYKGNLKGSYNNNTIVAEYVGRMQEADDVNKIALQLGKLYNAEVMHENMVSHVKNYFRLQKSLHYLAVQPDAVISKSIKNSSVARVYGIHMNEQLKKDGAKYIKDWLLQVRDYDENGDPILNLETIYSKGLLEELITFNMKDNFDRVMAFMMCMFSVQEEGLQEEYDQEKENPKVKEIVEFMSQMYRR